MPLILAGRQNVLELKTSNCILASNGPVKVLPAKLISEEKVPQNKKIINIQRWNARLFDWCETDKLCALIKLAIELWTFRGRRIA